MSPMVTLGAGPYIPYFMQKRIGNSINNRRATKTRLDHRLPRVLHLQNGLERRSWKGCAVWPNERLSGRESGDKVAL